MTNGWAGRRHSGVAGPFVCQPVETTWAPIPGELAKRGGGISRSAALKQASGEAEQPAGSSVPGPPRLPEDLTAPAGRSRQPATHHRCAEAAVTGGRRVIAQRSRRRTEILVWRSTPGGAMRRRQSPVPVPPRLQRQRSTEVFVAVVSQWSRTENFRRPGCSLAEGAGPYHRSRRCTGSHQLRSGQVAITGRRDRRLWWSRTAAGARPNGVGNSRVAACCLMRITNDLSQLAGGDRCGIPGQEFYGILSWARRACSKCPDVIAEGRR